MAKSDMDKLSKKGLTEKLPQLECFPNSFKNYKITLNIPEYTSLCPKTGLPDFGTLTLYYVPDQWCVELKSFKTYIHAYRNLGISYENAVNRILKDFVSSAKPKWAYLRALFTPRGGISSCIEVKFGNVPKEWKGT